MMMETFMYQLMYLQAILSYKATSCSFVNMWMPGVYKDDMQSVESQMLM
jgi:hypothetical protein